MTVYEVNDLVMDGFVKEANKNIIMVGVGIASSECQLVQFLEEFLSHLTPLTQKCQLILGIGFLISILEGFFASPVEGSKGTPIWYHSIDDLVNEIGSKLLREPSCEETEVKSDVGMII